MDKTVIQHIENYTTPQLHCHIFPLIPLQGEAEEGEGKGGEEGRRGGGERRILTRCSWITNFLPAIGKLCDGVE